jgi:hypothetical protein
MFHLRKHVFSQMCRNIMFIHIYIRIYTCTCSIKKTCFLADVSKNHVYTHIYIYIHVHVSSKKTCFLADVSKYHIYTHIYIYIHVHVSSKKTCFSQMCRNCKSWYSSCQLHWVLKTRTLRHPLCFRSVAYVCMLYVCMYVRTYVHVWTRTLRHPLCIISCSLCVCIHACMHVLMHVHVWCTRTIMNKNPRWKKIYAYIYFLHV